MLNDVETAPAPEKAPVKTSPVAFLLVILAFVFALGGLATTTQATQGVAAIALACFVGILARMAQAAHHFKHTR